MTTKRRKRGQNEGSIYQRADGLWVAAVNLNWREGKRSRKYLYGKTRAEVAGKLTVALHDKGRGVPIKVERQTVAQFLQHWLTDVIEPTRRPGTLKSYEQHVRVHLVPAFGNKQLARLTPQDVQSMVTSRLNGGLSAQTVRSILSTLRLALSQAERWGMVTRNVATLVDPPRTLKFEPSPLSDVEVQRLLAAVKGDRLEALYLLSIKRGLREGEALGLRWQDVDLDAGRLSIRYSLQRLKTGMALVEPKTERSRRTVELSTHLVAALAAHSRRQEEEASLKGDGWNDWNLVFCSRRGTPIDVTHLGHHFKKALAQAGLSDRRWHDLRHTFVTLGLSAGIPERIIMETLGHTRLDMTRLYGHVMVATKRAALDRIDEALDVDMEAS